MQHFFLDIWRKRHHVSEISGTFLGNEPLSIYFHHILPKNKREYLQAKYDPENIILLTLDEHSNVEINENRYEKINQRRELLKIKYELT